MKSITLLICLLLLPGCAFLNGKGDYEHYTTVLATHSESESVRIEAQATAITELTKLSINEAKTPAEAALQSAIAVMVIGNLHPSQLTIQKPTTGMDVANNLVNQVPFVSGMVGMYKLGEAGIKAAGNIKISNSSVSESLNPIENHSTGSSTTATVTPKDPVVVRPEVVMVPGQ